MPVLTPDSKWMLLIETQVLKVYPAYAQCAERGDLPSADQNKPDPINNVPMVSSSRSAREKSRDRGKKSGVPEEWYFFKTNSETYPSGPVSLLARQAPRMMYAQATK